MNEFAIYKRFQSENQANDLLEVLKDNGIEAKVVADLPTLDSTFLGNSVNQGDYQLMVAQRDFEKANQLFEQSVDAHLSEVATDYYLYGFTNQELYDILAKPDEWNILDYKLAQRILISRGEQVTDQVLSSYKNMRMAELSAPKEEKDIWIILGYVFAFCGGLLGVFMGWYLWKMEKTLPTGEKIFYYSEEHRKHGENMFYIGIVVFPLTFLGRIFGLI